MIRELAFGTFGLAEAIWPRQFVDWWMGVATKGDSEVELRGWVYTAARIEGVVLLLWALRRSRCR
jgi:hypothetical protein